MKTIRISINGVTKVKAGAVTAKNGQQYYAVTHGEQGRGRWEVRLPLGRRDFPCPEDHGPEFDLDGRDLKLIDLKKTDPRGNSLYLLASGQDDGEYLVFWNLSPGYRGGAHYKVSGNATVITFGEEAQGDAGRMGGADCPVVYVTGPCRLEWTRTGRLYGNPAEWVAEFDGKDWNVNTVDQCALEDAALNY